MDQINLFAGACIRQVGADLIRFTQSVAMGSNGSSKGLKEYIELLDRTYIKASEDPEKVAAEDRKRFMSAYRSGWKDDD